MGGIGRREGIKMASANTQSASKDLILIHTAQLNPILKAQISGKLVSDAAFDSVSSEKTRMKKYWIVIIIIITEKPSTRK